MNIMGSEILTLQELSIKVVIDEFSRYAAAQKSTKNEWFKKNLLFLQKLYSYSIFQELEKIGKLKEEHLDFLLNEYLRKLDVGALLGLTSKENLVQKVIPIAHSLTDLSCESNYWNLYILKEVLPHAFGVTKLLIPDFCNDDLLKLIASTCPQLTYLDLFESDITGEGLKCFYHSRCSLKYIRLGGTVLCDEDVACLLENVPSLEEVIFQRLPNVLQSIHQKYVDSNHIVETKKYNLTDLDFLPCNSRTLPSNLLKMCSEICPNVRKLAFYVSKIEELEQCCLFTNLEAVSILNGQLSRVDLNNFLKTIGKQLRRLRVKMLFRLSVSTLIDNCLNLEWLELTGVHYQEMHHKTTKVFPHLQFLELSFISFQDLNSIDSVIALLNSCPNLEELSLSDCIFKCSNLIEKLSAVSNNCQQEHLCIDYYNIEAYALHLFISICSCLKKLRLVNCDNLSFIDIDMLNEHMKASNRKIKIIFIPDYIRNYNVSDYLGCDADVP